MSKKKTTTEIVSDFSKVHGDYYDYSLVDYINAQEKVKIICPIHGAFEILARHHILGRKCPNCSKLKKWTTETFIQESEKIHKQKYNYVKSVYVNSKTKIEIICPTHGSFYQLPYTHIQGHGCPKCANSVKLTKEEFIEKSKKIHGDYYDYSLVNYVNNYTKVKIICPINGVFEQTPASHFKNKPLILKKEKRKKKTVKKLINSFDEFLLKAKSVHADYYDYSLVDFKGSKSKIKIICPKHGVFEQTPYIHVIKKNGCCKCGRIKAAKKHNELSRLKFIQDLEKLDSKYDYSKVNYIKADLNVEIVCPDHGPFFQTPLNHKQGKGCPECAKKYNYSENELFDFVNNLILDDCISNDKSLLEGKELDILIPNRKIAFEYNGLYWHSYNKKESMDEINYHLDKTIKCQKKGIQLIHINEDEWLHKKEIVKSIIRHKLGQNNNKIYSRKCSIKELTTKEFNDFCEINHIQGKRNSSIRFGLIYENVLVSVMGFSTDKNYDYELTRYCQKINTNVLGSASKLWAYFLKMYKPNTVLSYCDKRWSRGNLYKMLGMDMLKSTKPNFRYVKNNKSFSRQMFQKHKLKNRLKKFNPSLTGYQNMFNNGYRRMWDCGNYKFVYINREDNEVCLL